MADFRELCAELVDCLEKANWPLRHKTVFGICLDNARAALAQPEPEPIRHHPIAPITMTPLFNYRAELQRLVQAYDDHGGRWSQHHEDALDDAVEAARATLAQPEPENPSDAELDRLTDSIEWKGSPRHWGRKVIRAALTRWRIPANNTREENLNRD